MDMRRGNVSISAMLGLSVVLGGSGCWSEVTDQTHSVRPAETARELIGGFAATDPAFDAIGSISMRYSDPWGTYWNVVCSGALIAPNTVITAKHCLDAATYWDPNNRLVFTLGPDAYNPIAYYDIVDFEAAPGDVGGFNYRGHDVGVFYLDVAPTDVKPVGLGTLSEQDVGEDFVGTGFGVIDNSQRFGLRRVGKLGLMALEGRVWEKLLGSFESYYRWSSGAPLPPECVAESQDGGITVLPPITVDGGYIDCSSVDYALAQWESQRLETVGEFVAGGGEDDAQPCYGDSGAPLLRAVKGTGLIAYGVVNGGVGSARQICDYGSVYAGFGSEVMEFLERAKEWVDPCGDQTWVGSCDGAVAQRCSNPGEGRRRIISFDCRLVGKGCYAQADGALGCGIGADAIIPPIVSPVPIDRIAAPVAEMAAIGNQGWKPAVRVQEEVAAPR